MVGNGCARLFGVKLKIGIAAICVALAAVTYVPWMGVTYLNELSPVPMYLGYDWIWNRPSDGQIMLRLVILAVLVGEIAISLVAVAISSLRPNTRLPQ